MDQAHDRVIDVVRKNIDKVLIAISGLTLLAGGWVTLDFKNYTDCQVQLLEASRDTTTSFRESLVVLLATPPRPIEERRQALVRLQEALQKQQQIQQQLGSCK